MPATADAAAPRPTLDPLDFTLPPQLEAHEPPEARGLGRDGVRLMVSADDGHHITHSRFPNLPRILQPGDLVVANDSATLPAAITARRASGEEIALHFSTELSPRLWVVEPRRIQAEIDEVLALLERGAVTLLAPYHGSPRLWVAQVSLPATVPSVLRRWGRPIAYPYIHGRWPLAMYQTVYAREPGSAEMPSAGRPFSAAVLADLASRGIGFATLTLHTGVASLEDHEPPYAERFEVPEHVAAAVRATRARGRRVIAVGTTVVRALESSLGPDSKVVASRGWTDLVISPERGVRAIDGLLTGFHEPRASHLAMLEAIVGRPHLERAYAAALTQGYLWHEFGDVHLLLA